MADRVAVGKIIVGHGDDRREIPAGTRFNTETAGIDDKDVRRMELSGILRRPRDDTRPAPIVAGPGATVAEEPAGGGGDGGDDDQEVGREGTRTAGQRRGRAKTNDLDL